MQRSFIRAVKLPDSDPTLGAALADPLETHVPPSGLVQGPVRYSDATYSLLGTGAACIALVAPAIYTLVAGTGALAIGLVQTVLLIACIAGACAALRYPVHVHVRGSIYFTNVPMYLLAALLPAPVGALGALVGMSLGCLQPIGRKRWCWGRAALFAGRWSAFVFIGSLVAHIPAQSVAVRSLVLVGSAATMCAADFLTFPLTIPRMAGESMLRVTRDYIQTASQLEVPQYLVALLGVAGFASLPWSPALLVIPVAMLYRNGKRTKELQDTTSALLAHLADAVDLRDAYTGGHSRRVTAHVESILRRFGSTGNEAIMFLNAARVHDIGKIGVPDDVLRKPGPLTPEERAVMEGHAAAGAELLRGHEDFSAGVEIVRHHHESWDGTGYPDRLAAYDIPLGARILAVADSYDAMTSDRPYRAGMSHVQAIAVLEQGAGKQWDPAVVEAFVAAVSTQPVSEPIAEARIRQRSRARLNATA